MIHKLGHLQDLDNIVVEDEAILKDLTEFLSVLDIEYGEDRDVDNSDGGYVLYCEVGTSLDELEAVFNYKAVFDWSGNIKSKIPYCSTMYFLNNEFAVVLVMAIQDTPDYIKNEIEYR